MDLGKITEIWIKEHEKTSKVAIATGNTRYVYSLAPGYIIKECNYEYGDDDGIYCNKVEYELYQHATEKERKFLNPTIAIYGDGKYVVATECYPIDCYILNILNKDVRELEDCFQDIEDFVNKYPDFKLDLNDVSKFCAKVGISEDEFRGITNWGILDNRLVCIDYN